MGIRNRNNALYMATGIDNSGLYSGRREAIGILKAMAGEITSFDVFGGIGISAGIAFASAAKDAYNFEKQFQQSMKEVATLSSGIKGSLTDYMNQVMDLTREVPVQANDAAKALYQIVSAGHDGAKGMNILEVSAKAAIGGVTETATAADAITTVLNAYKQDASEAQRISDLLFTTVRLGKTNFGELGRSIAQAAPIAASYGVEIEQVLSAVASLTKQGTPTAQAMTQIRASIIGVSKVLGDGAFDGRTYQEALAEVARRAAGSESELRSLVPEIEAVNAVLGMTGKNAQAAASDLEQMGSSAGASEAAFGEMVSSAQNQLQLLQNNITAFLRPMGEAILKEVSGIATSFNEAFANGDVQESMRTLGDLIVIVTGALVGYKGSIIATTTAKTVYHTITSWIAKQKSLEAANLVLTKGLYATEATMIAKNTSMRVLLTKALKAQFAASVKATGAMLANPYVLAAAAVAGLGYGLYKLATAESAAEKAARMHREEQERFQKVIDERKQKIDKLLRIIQDETETEYAKIKAYEELRQYSPALVAVYSREELATLELAKSQKILNKERDSINYENVISNINRITNQINEQNRKLRLGTNQGFLIQNKLNEDKNILEQELNKYKKQLDEYNRIKKQAEEDAKPVKVKLLEAENNRDQIVQEYAAAELVLEQEQEKIKNSPFATIPIDVQIRFNNAQIALKDIDNIVNNLQSQQNNTSNSENETYKQAYDKAKANWKAKIKALEDAKKGSKADYEKAKKELEESEKAYKDLGGITGNSLTNRDNEAEKLRQQQQKSSEELLALRRLNQQDEIDLMEEGSEKRLKQIELDYQKELDAIRKKEQEWSKANGGKLTEEQSVQISLSYSQAESKRDKSISEMNKEEFEAMNRYLKEYGTFQQRKDVITKEYSDKIAKATTEGDKKILQKEMEESLSSLNMDKLKQEINWELIFGDLSKVSKRSLEQVKQQLKAFKNSDEYKNMTVDQKKVIDEALNNIQSTIIDKGGLLGNLPEQLDALRIAQEELNQAQEEYNDAIKHGTDAEKEAALKKKNNAEKNVQNAEVNVTKSTDKTKQNLITLADTITQLGSSSEISLSQIGSLASGLVDVFTEAGSKIGGIVGAAFSLLDAIGKQGLDGFVENVFSSVFKASTGIWDTITFGAFSKITGSGDSDKNLEKDIEYLAQSNQDLKNSLDNLSEKMDKASVADASDIYSVQRENILKQEANTRESMQRSASASSNGFLGIGGSHSTNYKINKGMSSSEWKRVSEIVGRSIQNASQFFKLSSEQMAKLAEEDTTLYSKIKSLADDGYKNAAQFMDEYITYYKQLEELENAYNEKLTNTSFDSVRSDFKNALLDMESDAEDFADNFEKMMQNAIVESLMTKKYDKLIQAWYNDFAKAMEGDGKIDEYEQRKLQDRWDSITNQALAERDALKDAMGWESESESESTSQSSTSKGFQVMSQDTGEELNGRFTALQIAGEEIKNQTIIQTGIQGDMLRRLEDIYKFNAESYDEYYDMMLSVIDILDNIYKNTNSLPRMEVMLKEIKEYSKALAGK